MRGVACVKVDLLMVCVWFSDYDECAFGTACENGVCMNTAGSFNCFCSPPLVLDSTRRRCVSLNMTEGAFQSARPSKYPWLQLKSIMCMPNICFFRNHFILFDCFFFCSSESFQNVHVDICWKRLEEDNMCSSPHQEERTTYAECCCLHGVAWSEQCALCPKGDSGQETEPLTPCLISKNGIFSICKVINGKLCFQRTLRYCATCRGEGARTVCASSRDMSTVWREQRTTWTPLSLLTLTITGTPQDHMTSQRAFPSSLTMTTASSSRLPASPSLDHRNTRHTAWIRTPVGFHFTPDIQFQTLLMFKNVISGQYCTIHMTNCDISSGFLLGRYDSFEGLRAEECGILNGCENGRCVRVREGYTCDCFDGYEFNLKKMACVGGCLDLATRSFAVVLFERLKRKHKQASRLTARNEPEKY